MVTLTVRPPDFDLPQHYLQALEIKESGRAIKMPEMYGWNPDYPLRPFQEIGVAYLLAARKAILADATGLGKTIQLLALIQTLKSLEAPYRTLCVVPNYKSEMQWWGEANKFTDLLTVPILGEKPERIMQMSSWWELMLTRPGYLLRDLEYLMEQDYDIFIFDEASLARHHSAKTAQAMKALAYRAGRVILSDATPIQKSIEDMHSLLEAFNLNIFGPLTAFNRRYIRREPVTFRKGRRIIHTSKIVGYQNMNEFKERCRPFYIRRKPKDVEAEMPELVVKDVWLTPGKEQQAAYKASMGKTLEAGTSAARGRMARIKSGYHAMQGACDSTYAIDPGSAKSVKLDWIMNTLQNDLTEEKVIIFSQWKPVLFHLEKLLEEAGISFRAFTGDQDNAEKDAAYDAFWNDDSMRVLLGTTALERSLNLQKSAYLIAINQIWNPRRMEQLVGRINRMGSEHATCCLINLLTEGTVEEKLHMRMSAESAAGDYTFGEKSDLFEALSEEDLLALIRE